MLKRPEMRHELLDVLKDLSDPNYQKRAWVDREFPPGVRYDELDYKVHFLFDDTLLAEDPARTIGWILRNEEEAYAIRRLASAIDRAIDAVGKDGSDADYICSDQWPEVVDAAKAARQLLQSNDNVR